jgi:DNA helicase-2/ATP-dependent DNA helicase PcrA
MAQLRERAEAGAPIAELLEAVLHDTGYLEALEAERTIEAQDRIENLEQLVEVAREFDAVYDGEESRLDAFLQHIALVSNSDTRRDDEDVVTLMTLHNAKGLEYPVVFIIGCVEGVLPHKRAIDEGALEEERRLFYVGMTRAMRTLTLTYARRRNVNRSTAYDEPSRFLAEIPPELVDRDEGPAAGAGCVSELLLMLVAISLLYAIGVLIGC